MHASPEAIAIFERQRHYDRLHHLQRIEWLESLPRLSDIHRRMLKQSRKCVSDPSGMHGYNSCDTDDESYLAELDEFSLRANREALKEVAGTTKTKVIDE